MTVYCEGDCHVWLGSSSLCTCEAHRVAMLFPGYNPFGPHAPQKAAPDVPLAQFQAAQSAGASHLSGDGSKVYQTRYGKVYEAGWQGDFFGAWWPLDGDLPADAVVLDKE